MAIQSFANPVVERFFSEGRLSKKVGWANVAKVAARKLDMLDYAGVLMDLASPPGNRLEALKGKLAGFHSIGGSSSAGPIPVPPRSTSGTTTEEAR